MSNQQQQTRGQQAPQRQQQQTQHQTAQHQVSPASSTHHYLQPQLPSYVPFSHPPLLSQLQSQSSLAPMLGSLGGANRVERSPTTSPSHGPVTAGGPQPATACPPSRSILQPQHQQRSAGTSRQQQSYRGHFDPSRNTSGITLSPPPAAGPPPPTAPLINLLNVQMNSGAPSAGGHSATSTPFEDSNSSSPRPSFTTHLGNFPSVSPSHSITTSIGDDLADIESYLPFSPITTAPSSPVATAAAAKTTPSKKKCKKPSDSDRRVLSRKVEGPWTQVQPLHEVEGPEILVQDVDSDDSEVEELVRAVAPSCPSQRFGHVAVVRPSTNQMVVFGGRQTGICYDDMWTADLGSVKAATSSTLPSPAPEGGSSPTPAPTSTRKKTPIPQATMQWTQVDKPRANADLGAAVWPCARAGHTAVITKEEEILMFGGGTETEFYGELYSYDFKTSSWTLLHDYDTSTHRRNYDAQVRPRKGHTAVWDENQGSMFVYGGLMSLDQPVRDSTVWKYERRSNQWSPMPASTGEQPADRTYHVAAFDDSTSSMLVFGGRSIRETPSYPFLGDLHSFNTQSGVWTHIEASGPEAPPPRMCATSAFYNGRFFVSHGGHTRYLNDSYEYDPKREKWSKSTETPSALTRPTVVVHDNTLTIFGGCDHEIFVNDCHQLKLAAPSLFDLCSEWLNDAKLVPPENPPQQHLCASGNSSVTSACDSYGIPPLTLGSALGPDTPPLRAQRLPRGGSVTSPNMAPASPSLTGATPMMLALHSNTGSPQVSSQAFGAHIQGGGRFSGGSLRQNQGGMPHHHHTSPSIMAASASSLADPRQPTTPLPHSVLLKTQAHLKAQGVLPPPVVHPRLSHIPTQPFF